MVCAAGWWPDGRRALGYHWLGRLGGRMTKHRIYSVSVASVYLQTMTPEQKRAYVIADNKLALNAGWDEEVLAEELKALLAVDIDFDVGVTGFSIPDIDGLIEGLSTEEPG